MYSDETRLIIEKEFTAAGKARQDGLEGRARVCARRAAGAAAREFFLRRAITLPVQDAYSVLILLTASPDVPPAAVQAASRLTQRVDEQFHLSSEIDLIEEARIIISELEKSL